MVESSDSQLVGWSGRRWLGGWVVGWLGRWIVCSLHRWIVGSLDGRVIDRSNGQRWQTGMREENAKTAKGRGRRESENTKPRKDAKARFAR